MRDRDCLQADSATGTQQSVHGGEVLRPVLGAHCLDHLDTHDRVERTLYEAVIEETDIHTVSDTRLANPFGCQSLLLG